MFGQLLKLTNKEDKAMVSKSKSKMDKAKEVFEEMYGKEGVERKHIINEFVQRCELTNAGASTYYNTIKKLNAE